MKGKKIKTEFGTMKAVVPKKKKAKYGNGTSHSYMSSNEKGEAVEALPYQREQEEDELVVIDDIESQEEKDAVNEAIEKLSLEEEMEAEEEKMDAELREEMEEIAGETLSSENVKDKMEALMEAIQQMQEWEKQDAEKKEAEEKKKQEELEKSQGQESGEEKQKEESQESEENNSDKEQGEQGKDQSQSQQQQQQDNEYLTKLLRSKIRLKALVEISHGVKSLKSGNNYFTYSIPEGGLIGVVKFTAYEDRIVWYQDLPYFETEAQANAFLDLCGEFIHEYLTLVAHLDPTQIIIGGNFKVVNC